MIRSGLILMIKDLTEKCKSAYAIGQEIGVSKNTVGGICSNQLDSAS